MYSGVEWEDGNNHDKFFSLLKHATVLGQVPRQFSWVFWHFLRHEETITWEVTDQRKLALVLFAPCTTWHVFLGPQSPFIKHMRLTRDGQNPQ